MSFLSIMTEVSDGKALIPLEGPRSLPASPLPALESPSSLLSLLNMFLSSTPIVPIPLYIPGNDDDDEDDDDEGEEEGWAMDRTVDIMSCSRGMVRFTLIGEGKLIFSTAGGSTIWQ